MDPAEHSVGENDEPRAVFPTPPVSEAQRARVRARLFGGETPEPVHLIGGKYRRLALVGEGGIGTVWEVEHVLVGRRFALKLLKDRERDSNGRKRFLREARAASKVRHENIVEVTDAGETDDGTPYVVMELLVGQTLAQAIDEAGAMPWARARGILMQVASALGCAHKSGIVHRDLKAENVMLVAHSDKPDLCKIVDFGLAKMLDPDRTQHSRPGSVFGTPATMSPEQIRGESIDARTDVYALGCMAFHMLTGRRPFVGPTHESVFAQHLSDPPPSVGDSIRDGELRARIDGFLARALAKDRDDRLADMADVVDAIDAVDRASATPPTVAAVPSIAPHDPLRRERLRYTSHLSRRGWATIATGVAAGGLAVIAWRWSIETEPPASPTETTETLETPSTRSNPKRDRLGTPAAVGEAKTPGAPAQDSVPTTTTPTTPDVSGAAPADTEPPTPAISVRKKKPRRPAVKPTPEPRPRTGTQESPPEDPPPPITSDNVLSRPLPNPFGPKANADR